MRPRILIVSLLFVAVASGFATATPVFASVGWVWPFPPFPKANAGTYLAPNQYKIEDLGPSLKVTNQSGKEWSEMTITEKGGYKFEVVFSLPNGKAVEIPKEAFLSVATRPAGSLQSSFNPKTMKMEGITVAAKFLTLEQEKAEAAERLFDWANETDAARGKRFSEEIAHGTASKTVLWPLIYKKSKQEVAQLIGKPDRTRDEDYKRDRKSVV